TCGTKLTIPLNDTGHFVLIASIQRTSLFLSVCYRRNAHGTPMSAKGCCYDNACVESFFHSLKVECIHGEHFISREIMRATVFNYIECDYNRWRRHSWCGGLSPEQFENKNLA
ncbi:IS3 family transposase, partial [Escherichia coli]